MHTKPRATPNNLTDRISDEENEEWRKARHDLAKSFISALVSNDRFIRQLLLIPEKLKEWELDAIRLLDMMDAEGMMGLDDYLIKYPPSAGVIVTLVQLSLDRSASAAQRKAALAKAAKYEPARKIVVDAWLRDKGGCKSKADFARIFSQRVKNQLGIEVTPRTIEREWLRRR